MKPTLTLISGRPNRKQRRATKPRHDGDKIVKGINEAIAMAAPSVSAESVVRQENYFPMFKDGGPHVGVLYTKTWQAPFVNGVTDEWRNRVAGYWERLEKKFGVIWSRPVIDYDDETGSIVTMATVLVVIPGERYEVQG